VRQQPNNADIQSAATYIPPSAIIAPAPQERDSSVAFRKGLVGFQFLRLLVAFAVLDTEGAGLDAAAEPFFVD
jgi:hypothetical protein